MTDTKLFYFSPDTAHVYLGGGNPAVIFPVAPMTRVRVMLDKSTPQERKASPRTVSAAVPVPPRRRLVEDKMGVAPMALPRHAGAGGIMMGIPAQLRAGLTFTGRPSGPRWGSGQGPLRHG